MTMLKGYRDCLLNFYDSANVMETHICAEFINHSTILKNAGLKVEVILLKRKTVVQQLP